MFGAAADPVVLDAALISDGESFRVVYQITETLVGLKPGTTQLAPMLATKWVKSNGGRRWTFTLRRNVEFHDGTPFNAAAVCANFNRWYNFKGAQQSSSASYYYNYVFGGFKTKGAKDALYRNCSARGSNVAVINLKRPYGPFLAAMTLSPFAIQSPTSMKENGADKGRLTSDGVYQPLGEYGVPGGVAAGTGPFKLDSWRIGDKLELERNDEYWGRRPSLDASDLPRNPRQRGAPPGAPDRGDRRLRPRRATGHQDAQAQLETSRCSTVRRSTSVTWGSTARSSRSTTSSSGGPSLTASTALGRAVVLCRPWRGGARVHATERPWLLERECPSTRTARTGRRHS